MYALPFTIDIFLYILYSLFTSIASALHEISAVFYTVAISQNGFFELGIVGLHRVINCYLPQLASTHVCSDRR